MYPFMYVLIIFQQWNVQQIATLRPVCRRAPPVVEIPPRKERAKLNVWRVVSVTEDIFSVTMNA